MYNIYMWTTSNITSHDGKKKEWSNDEKKGE